MFEWLFVNKEVDKPIEKTPYDVDQELIKQINHKVYELQRLMAIAREQGIDVAIHRSGHPYSTRIDNDIEHYTTFMLSANCKKTVHF